MVFSAYARTEQQGERDHRGGQDRSAPGQLGHATERTRATGQDRSVVEKAPQVLGEAVGTA